MKRNASPRRAVRSITSATRILPLLTCLLCSIASPQETEAPAVITLRPDTSRNELSSMINEHMSKGDSPNRLINEKSPYLLQHAFNPVDWYPWGEEAFTRAREENKPIFLSIGYSTCYWCHVMEREVFENPDIAAMMNKFLVCIKVDREERPDIDRLYMTAVQALTGSGGWPMSVFLTPDLKPFFGGTYFPPTPQQGRISFPQVVERISEIWRNDDRRLRESGEQVISHILTYATFSPEAVEDDAVIQQAYQEIAASFDSEHPGFGGAPKFPRPSLFNFLFSRFSRTGNPEGLRMALETLRAMAAGGVYDHIGGGFHRYSVDDQWRVPHFEKMLYDQAQLTVAYLTAYQISGDSSFATMARDILSYVSRTMTDRQGGFFSAEDAESAMDASDPGTKEEGVFYLWTRQEMNRYLGEKDGAIFSDHFGILADGNALADPLGVFEGKNILYRVRPDHASAAQNQMTPEAFGQFLSTCRGKLFEARELRPKPFRDEKILTAWNGLMISAYAKAYQVLRDSSYLLAAQRAATFVLEQLRRPDGSLLRRYRDGEARFDGSLQDYAFMCQALTDLYESDFDIRWLDEALALTAKQLGLFWNVSGGGFYDTPAGESTLLMRTREDYDGAEPTGNSIAALNLVRLGRITGNTDWMGKAHETVNAFGARLKGRPDMLPQMLVALDMRLSVPREIVIAGDPSSPAVQEILAMLQRRYLPNMTLLLADGGRGQGRLATFLPFLKDMKTTAEKPTVYFCENYACQLPTDDLTVISERIASMAIMVR